VYGGAAISKQIKALKKPQHIIIATPGRLIDLIKRKSVKLNRLRFLILDEADEMLNMGFQEAIDEILQYTPDDKFTWLFSATMPKEIRRIAKKYMDDPVEVKVSAKNQVNENIEHRFATVKRADKNEALCRFIDINPNMRSVVFCRTKRDTQELAESLMEKGYNADALHGDLSQAQRDKVMKKFRVNKINLLIATDVAARGIDVNDLTHVFHFSLPDTSDYYTHRSGRTARAGKKGMSIAFVSGRDKNRISWLSQTLDISFEKITIPQSKDIAELRIQRWCNEILEQKSKNIVDEALIENAMLLFGNLSKEELIKKIVAKEFNALSSNDTDLNDNDKSKSSKRGRDRRGFSRKKRSDSKRSGKGNRSRGRSKEDNKKSGKKRKKKKRY